ncbi:MAG: Tad domain-containing protein [Oligoflexia bacterium]|nr:Tad domain-containing protein [Oligoflexia bacterium]
MKLDSRGQLSVFFAMVIVVLVTTMAFTVNVGMFVKAKINLQNAVDAAAWSGAAVQARQLSTIAYLNWELRNVYKEWMFKYYVLGMISLPRSDPSASSAFTFRMEQGFSAAQGGDNSVDAYNVPSTCIHFAQEPVNTCRIYNIVGLPRFAPLGMPGIDDTMNKFTDATAKMKSEGCSRKSNINFLTLLRWTYGVPTQTQTQTSSHMMDDDAGVAIDRLGAWPAAIELAYRIRNVEKIVNTPPAPNPVCNGGQGCTTIGDYHQENTYPINERVVKAFWSAYRNLDSGSRPYNILKESFQLTEFAPNKYNGAKANTPSTFPINDDIDKYYLDLNLLTVNLVVFYTQFTAVSGSLGGTRTDASCTATKTGIPVPAYPFGFIKNPDVLTYYAVKGEADFIGLFNPFQEQSVKMTAYAAAKPFGGRIGPMIFMRNKNIDLGGVYARDNRSYNYLGYIAAQPNSAFGAFQRGYPLPNPASASGTGVSGFWITNTDISSAIGGAISANNLVKSAIPNLLYINKNIKGGNEKLSNIEEVLPGNDTNSPKEKAGLYGVDQYLAFRENMPMLLAGGASNMSPGSKEVQKGIFAVRAPTMHEAYNFLIPTSYDSNGLSLSSSDSPSVQPIVNQPVFDQATGSRMYYLYAPLISDSKEAAFFKGGEIEMQIKNFLLSVQKSVDSYANVMYDTAKEMRAQAGTPVPGASLDIYDNAANSIYSVDDGSGNLTLGTRRGTNNPDISCVSIAGRFISFFLGGTQAGVKNCESVNGAPLFKLVKEYWSDQMKANPSFEQYYSGIYTPMQPKVMGYELSNSSNSSNPNHLLMTAYSPGQNYGADEIGVVEHPFNPGGKNDIVAVRNYYSTKFIPIGSVARGGNYTEYAPVSKSSMTVYSEGDTNLPSDIEAGGTGEEFANNLSRSMKETATKRRIQE